MGTAKPPAPVKLIAGLLAASDGLLDAARRALGDQFGTMDATSEVSAWTHSAYYRDEMGDAIRRQFVTFARLVAPDELVGLKQLSNRLEQAWCTAAGRQVNIDPGYLATDKLVLASTKDAAHRIYLGNGIYAEVTLHFCNGSFQPYAHSYRDYAAPEAIAFFNRARAQYLVQRRDALPANGHRAAAT
ncbi:MAG: hypothetical protein H6Q33_4994 [Deltaproteobacteria bacterium]|nr:hypothetical protein [Deltaproteobacteria bacterium]